MNVRLRKSSDMNEMRDRNGDGAGLEGDKIALDVLLMCNRLDEQNAI